jgi:branched-chain amino acid transport system ATP-binding protein
MGEILKVDGIDTYYGLSHVLFGASLLIREREVVFLLGRNGVGKTTTLLSIMGAPSPRSGSIKYHGKEISGLPTHKIAKLGVVLVPEGRRILSGLSVQENLELAAMGMGKRETNWTLQRVLELFPKLQSRRRQEAVTLSGGEQQMLAIARGLMSNPTVLLVDAPVEGLAPLIAIAVGDILLQLKKEAVTMLCADDDAKLARESADRVYFMDQGQVVWNGSIEKVLENDQEVAKRFLGFS